MDRKHLRSFCSKILLFGEYSIIKESMALSLPYPLFEGTLCFRGGGETRQIQIDPELKAFAQYLKNLKVKELLDNYLDVSSFEFDVEQGLYFNSTIPQGFGVGSSGALCAAIYQRYGNQVIDLSTQEGIINLKEHFSLLESHFHGKSSGVDPLISYMRMPIIIKNKSTIGPVNINNAVKNDKGGLFLLNTGRPRRTEPLVNLFLEKCKSSTFNQLCDNVLLPITNGCIDSFLKGNFESLYEFFRELSDFQYRHFAPMIPKLFMDIWKDGLKSEDYYLKLCGAGGGGFILGMTKDFHNIQERLSQYQIRPLIFNKD